MKEKYAPWACSPAPALGCEEHAANQGNGDCLFPTQLGMRLRYLFRSDTLRIGACFPPALPPRLLPPAVQLHFGFVLSDHCAHSTAVKELGCLRCPCPRQAEVLIHATSQWVITRLVHHSRLCPSRHSSTLTINIRRLREKPFSQRR